jgi:hypothetical protein
MTASTTLDELQRVSDRFHELADAVLRHNYPELRSLKPYGINAEGKPIQGTPDSYVGPSPKECVIAVEHTTTNLDGLKGKFLDDYGKVARECKSAGRVFLCTNRPEDEEIGDVLLEQARTDGRSLEIVWGEDIARTLDDQRQDLREKFLYIPLRNLTQDSLRPALQGRLEQSLRYLPDPQSIQSRLFRRPLEGDFQRLRPSQRGGVTLVVGEPGQGKTTWSVATARDLARTTPVAWFPAKNIRSDHDLNAAIVDATYGTQAPARADELTILLRRHDRKLVVFVDALDEHSDYTCLLEEMRKFSAQSPLAPHTHLVLTCRTEALALFESLDSRILPSPSWNDEKRRLHLDPLREPEAEQLLTRLGATPGEVATLKATLPGEFFGNPLYLKLTRRLQEGGSLPKSDVFWVAEFARYFVNEICGRLRAKGVGPSAKAITNALGELACRAIRDPRGAEPEKLESGLVSNGLAGEGTLLERAVQSGLLTRNEGRLQFCHPLLCEYFVARHIVDDGTKTPDDKVRVIATLPGRGSLAQIAMALDGSLATTFAARQPVLISSFDAAKLDNATTLSLLERSKELLASPYRSERAAAVRILSTLKTSEAIGVASKWFNSLDEKNRFAHLDEAAELFLLLDFPGAVRVIAHHRRFCLSYTFVPWLDPGFARVIDGLSPTLRKELADLAVGEMEIVDGLPVEDVRLREEARLTTILTYLKDLRLVERLRVKVRSGPLTAEEHRALIHFNTSDAMEVYEKSCEHHCSVLDQVDPKTDENGVERASIWHRLVLNQSDIVQFPHDALLRTVKLHMQSDERKTLGFGVSYAETLRNAELVDEYARACAKRGGGSGDMIWKLVEGMDADGVLGLYSRAVSAEARRQILQAAGEIPGDRVEQVLLNALDDNELFPAACVGLTRRRSDLAGSRLHRELAIRQDWLRWLIVKALGRIRYEPALPDLVRLLEEIPSTHSGDDAAAENAEYELVAAIGRIGGDVAYDALVNRFGGNRFSDAHILAVLLDNHDESSRQRVRRLLETRPNAKNLLGEALGSLRYFRDDVSYFDGSETRFEFSDDRILEPLLDSAREHLARSSQSGSKSLDLPRDARAIAMFDSPKATVFLEELASMAPNEDREDLQSAVTYARDVLASRGNRTWARRAVEGHIRFMRKGFFHPREVERLRRWPRDLVREVILESVRSGSDGVGMCLYLLLEFADEGDVEFVQQNLHRAGTDWGDAIRQRLPCL